MYHTLPQFLLFPVQRTGEASSPAKEEQYLALCLKFQEFLCQGWPPQLGSAAPEKGYRNYQKVNISRLGWHMSAEVVAAGLDCSYCRDKEQLEGVSYSQGPLIWIPGKQILGTRDKARKCKGRAGSHILVITWLLHHQIVICMYAMTYHSWNFHNSCKHNIFQRSQFTCSAVNCCGEHCFSISDLSFKYATSSRGSCCLGTA